MMVEGGGLFSTAKIKTVVASSGSAEEVRKKLLIVHKTEKKGRRGILRKGSHY